MWSLFRRKPDALFYRQALEFVEELKAELNASGIHMCDIPSQTTGLAFQVASAPPDKQHDHARLQVVSIHKTIKKPMLDFFNRELERIVESGNVSIAWDDYLFSRKFIGMREDDSHFTGLILPYKQRNSHLSRGDLDTALNELLVSIHAHLERCQAEGKKGPRK